MTTKSYSRVMYFGIKATALIISFIILKNSYYLIKEFILRNNNFKKAQNDLQLNQTRIIPKHIHQVFFSEDIPEEFLSSQLTCRQAHEDFDYTFWNKTMVDNLVSAHYQSIKSMFHGYGHWVRRADVARYIILHRHGGIYLDMDVTCYRSLEPIRQMADGMPQSIIVRPTTPHGIGSDFIGASPRHPFLEDVIHSLPNSNRWFLIPHLTTMFSTGPTFFWGRYMNFDKPEEFYILENYLEYFSPNNFGTWHEVDSILIRHFQQHPRQLSIFWIFLLILSFIVVLVICRKQCFDVRSAISIARQICKR